MAKVLIVGGGFFGCRVGLHYRSRGFGVTVPEEWASSSIGPPTSTRPVSTTGTTIPGDS